MFIKVRAHIIFAWILIMSVCLPSIIYAQASFKFQKLSITDGLSQNSITTIFQDSNGFMWLGTHDGLNRYDGYEFKHYKHGEADSLTVADTFVLTIAEDVNGNIWFGDRLGFHLLNVKTDRITPFYIGSDVTFNSANQSHLLVSDPQVGVWIGTEEGLHHLPYSDLEKLTSDYPDKASLFEKVDEDIPVSVLVDDEYVWILSTERLSLYEKLSDAKVNRVKSWEIEASPYSELHKDEEGNIWVNTESNIFTVSDKSTLSQVNTLPSFPNITSFYLDSTEKLWIGTENGLFVADKKGNVLASVFSNPDDRTSLDNNYIYSIEEDAAGLIWVGVPNGGVNIYDASTNNFKRLTSDSNNEFALSNNIVWSAIEDRKGDVWIGTSNGLNKFVRKDMNEPLVSNFNVYESFSGIKKYYEGGESGLSTDFIRALLEDRDGSVWVGTSDGVFVYDSKTDFFTEFRDKLGLVGTQEIKSITYLLEDKKGLIWIASTGGLYVLDKKKKEVREFEVDLGDDNKLKTAYIMSVFEKEDGNILIGTNIGFAEWNRTTGIVTTHAFGPDTFESAFVTGFTEDRNSNIWFSTMGSGIVKFIPSENVYKPFSTDEGLSNSVVYSLMMDGEENIWMSTNEGISKFNIETELFENYVVNDGIASAEHSQNSFFKSSHGEMLFGGVTGVTIFDPGEIIQSEYAPSATITDIMVNYVPLTTNEKALLKEPFSRLNDIVLTPAKKVVSFEFSGFDFRNPQQGQYAYRLVNFKDEWIYTDANQRIAQYTNLDPGSYVFEVKAANSHGVWNANKAVINVSVLPPFWATWWFRLISATVLFLMVGAVVRYVSTRKLKAELRKLEVAKQIQDERERISRDLHDHVGSQLANLISGIDLVDTYAEHNDSHKARELLLSLKDEAQLTIKQLRDTIWALHQGGIRVDQFDEHIRSYVANQRKVSEILDVHFTTNISHSYELTATQALNLFRIVQEAIHNIVKHSGGKNMFITLECNNDEFKIDVADDGVFKEKEEYRESYGLSNMHERAKELGAVFSLKKSQGSGTSIAISLPLMSI